MAKSRWQLTLLFELVKIGSVARCLVSLLVGSLPYDNKQLFQSTMIDRKLPTIYLLRFFAAFSSFVLEGPAAGLLGEAKMLPAGLIGPDILKIEVSSKLRSRIGKDLGS